MAGLRRSPDVGWTPPRLDPPYETGARTGSVRRSRRILPSQLVVGRVFRVHHGGQHARDPVQTVTDHHAPAASAGAHVPDAVRMGGLPRHGRLLLKTGVGP